MKLTQDEYYMCKGIALMGYDEFKHLLTPMFYKVNKGAFLLKGHPAKVCKRLRGQLSN